VQFSSRVIKNKVEVTFNRILVAYHNARIQHPVKLSKVFENEDDAKHFEFEFLPLYSPFLNFVEELNRDIKVGVWRKNTLPGGTIEYSIMAAEVTLVEELEKSIRIKTRHAH